MLQYIGYTAIVYTSYLQGKDMKKYFKTISVVTIASLKRIWGLLRYLGLLDDAKVVCWDIWSCSVDDAKAVETSELVGEFEGESLTEISSGQIGFHRGQIRFFIGERASSLSSVSFEILYLWDPFQIWIRGWWRYGFSSLFSFGYIYFPFESKS